MVRLHQQLARESRLDNLSRIHNDYPICHFGYHPQIMRDKQDGEISLRLQFSQQFQNICLDGHIQRRRRLVRYK